MNPYERGRAAQNLHSQRRPYGPQAAPMVPRRIETPLERAARLRYERIRRAMLTLLASLAFVAAFILMCWAACAADALAMGAL